MLPSFYYIGTVNSNGRDMYIADYPGCGTPEFNTSDYVPMMGVRFHDAVIVCTNGDQTETTKDITEHLNLVDAPFVVALTMIDQLVDKAMIAHQAEVERGFPPNEEFDPANVVKETCAVFEKQGAAKVFPITVSPRLDVAQYSRFNFLTDSVFHLVTSVEGDGGGGGGRAPGSGSDDGGGDPPEHLLCPITLEIFADPVITPFGQTFERAAIVEHIGRAGTCPLTSKALAASDLKENYALRDALEVYKKATRAP